MSNTKATQKKISNSLDSFNSLIPRQLAAGFFIISIAEIDENHLWQKAVLGIASVANETARVNQTLDHVLNEIRGNPSLELLRSRIELL